MCCRRREADESRQIWQEFERTRPLADIEPSPEVTEPERTEAGEQRTPSADENAHGVVG